MRMRTASIIDAITEHGQPWIVDSSTARTEASKRLTMSRRTAFVAARTRSDCHQSCAAAPQRMDRIMTSELQTLSRFRRWAAAACVPLVLLAGCPQQQPAPGTVAAEATAPTSRRRHQLRLRLATQDRSRDSRESTQGAATDRSGRRKPISSGVDNYHSGTLEAARSDFDAAVDLMLTSGMDLKTDPQLSDEFEQLAERHQHAGNGRAEARQRASPRRIEAAPLDAADEVTFPAEPGADGEGRRRVEDDAVRSSAGDQRLCRRLHQLLLELDSRVTRTWFARWNAPASIRT